MRTQHNIFEDTFFNQESMQNSYHATYMTNLGFVQAEFIAFFSGTKYKKRKWHEIYQVKGLSSFGCERIGLALLDWSEH